MVRVRREGQNATEHEADSSLTCRIWALRRSDTLKEHGITHVLSVVGFSPDALKNFKDEPWSEYGKKFHHLLIDIDDVDDSDLLAEMPRAVQFIDEGLRPSKGGVKTSRPGNGTQTTQDGIRDLKLAEDDASPTGGVFIHCAAGKSRSVSLAVAYLLKRYPSRFDPSTKTGSPNSSASPTPASNGAPTARSETAAGAVENAIAWIRRTRAMAEPNDGFMEQLELWWKMGCPENVEEHPIYQRWVYKREVEEHVAVGQAPSRLRFEDEQGDTKTNGDAERLLRCKKCRRTLAYGAFINEHQPSAKPTPNDQPCPHYFVEPLSWMRAELERGEINGRLLCPNERCGASVGRYDWKGIRCACRAWITPGLSLQRARVDEELRRPVPGPGARQGLTDAARMGIRMPPGSGKNGNL